MNIAKLSNKALLDNYTKAIAQMAPAAQGLCIDPGADHYHRQAAIHLKELQHRLDDRQALVEKHAQTLEALKSAYLAHDTSIGVRNLLLDCMGEDMFQAWIRAQPRG